MKDVQEKVKERERCEAMMCFEKTLITDPTTKA